MGLIQPATVQICTYVQRGPLLLLSAHSALDPQLPWKEGTLDEQVQSCSTSGCWVELSGPGLQDPLAEAGLAVVPQVVLQVSLLIICNDRSWLDYSQNAQLTSAVVSLNTYPPNCSSPGGAAEGHSPELASLGTGWGQQGQDVSSPGVSTAGQPQLPACLTSDTAALSHQLLASDTAHQAFKPPLKPAPSPMPRGTP